MITGISLSETKDFISSFDKDEPKTVWKLGVLDAEVYASLGELANNPLKMMFELVRFGLKGFEGFKDNAGNEVKFSTVSRNLGPHNYKIVADNIMKIIPSQVVNEIGGERLRLSTVSEGEVKN